MDSLFDSLYTQKQASILDGGVQSDYIEAYKKMPIPNKKMEHWRYYNAAPLFEASYIAAEVTDVQSVTSKAVLADSDKLFFVNGIFQEGLSQLKSEIEVVSLAQLKATKSELFDQYFDCTEISGLGKFQSLNTCFVQNGVLILVHKPQETALEIVYLNTANKSSIAQTRNIIVAKANSEMKIIESHFALDGSKLLQNVATEIVLEDNASINYSILQDEAKDDFEINTIKVKQAKNSRFTANTLTLNGGVVRNNIYIDQEGENCETTLNGVFFPSEKEHFENNTKVNHKVPQCTTNELYRGIAKGEATGVFIGEIYVAPGAQKTLANQSNKNIVLSDKASIYSKPQLEIYADDVSCSHGSTTGQLDKDALFYCLARGIEYDQAVKLLLDAFFADVTQHLPFVELYEYVENVIKTKI